MCLKPGCFTVILFLSLIFIKDISAAALDVSVIARGTGEPVEGATVVIEDSDNYLITNNKGKAVFEKIVEPETIKVLAPGFETSIIKLKDDQDSIAVYLYPLQFEGEGINIVAERLPEKISKVTFSADELASAPGTQGDPLKILTSLPGIVATGEGTSEVYMRGSDREDNIVWANRVPIGYLYHFGGISSTINPAIISDINIFLGGFPVEYGNRLGGAIDVQLRAPRNDRNHYNVHLGTLESSFLVEGPLGKPGGNTAFYAGARRSYIDLLFSPEKFSDLIEDDDSEDERDEITTVPRFYDAQALIRHQTGKGYLDFYFFSAGDKLALDTKSGVKKDPQLAGRTSFDTEFHTLGMSWTHQWHDKLDHVMPLALYYANTKVQFGTDNTGAPFFANNEQLLLFWQPEVRWKRKKDEEIKFGLNFLYANVPLDLFISRPPDEDDINFDFTSQPKIRVKDTLKASLASPYIQQRKAWTNKFTSIFGFSYSKIDGTGGIDMSDHSPRLAMEYGLTNKTTLLASWGKYLQLPQGFELLDGFGNPELIYTEAEHRIIGVQQKLNTLWNIKVEAYKKPMKNLVIPIDDLPPNNFANEGKGEAYGLDVYLKREPKHGTTGWLSYSYAKSTRRNLLTGLERDFSGDQPHTLTLVWSQPFTDNRFGWFKNWKYWNWGVKIQAHSGSLYSPVTGRHLEDPADPTSRYIPEYNSGFNTKRTPFFYRVDLRIEKENFLKQSKMKFFIDLLNATFKKNVTDFDYGPEYERINNPRKVTGLPFFPVFGIEAEF